MSMEPSDSRRGGGRLLLAVVAVLVAVAATGVSAIHCPEPASCKNGLAPESDSIEMPTVDQEVAAALKAAAAEKSRERIAKSLSTLGGALKTVAAHVKHDEKVLTDLKEQSLDIEMQKHAARLDWPAIKDMINVEIKRGRDNIDSQVAKFKIDTLDLLQKGLASLRADLRATVTSGVKLSESPADALAARQGGEAVVERAEEMNKEELEMSLNRFLDGLDLGDSVRSKIEAFFHGIARAQRDDAPTATYTKMARAAVAAIESELQGTMSQRDMRREISKRLKRMVKAFEHSPSRAAREALRHLEMAVTDAMEEDRRTRLASEVRHSKRDRRTVREAHHPDEPLPPTHLPEAPRRQVPKSALDNQVDQALHAAMNAYAKKDSVAAVTRGVHESQQQVADLTRDVTKKSAAASSFADNSRLGRMAAKIASLQSLLGKTEATTTSAGDNQ